MRIEHSVGNCAHHERRQYSFDAALSTNILSENGLRAELIYEANLRSKEMLISRLLKIQQI